MQSPTGIFRLKETVWAMAGAEIDDIGESPNAGRVFQREVSTHADRTHADRLDAVKQLDALGGGDCQDDQGTEAGGDLCVRAEQAWWAVGNRRGDDE